MSPSEPSRDPVPSLAREVLALFADALTDVRFPDLDIDVLESSTQELLRAQLELERVELALEAARAVVANQADALTQRAQRALAYARVFAEGDRELSARVALIGHKGAPSQVDASANKKRGRPKKSESSSSLFGGVEGSARDAESSETRRDAQIEELDEDMAEEHAA